MRFRYSYNTPDNKRQDAIINASCREEVFDLLKAQGIKPFGVHLEPGAINFILRYWKRALLYLITIISVTGLGIFIWNGHKEALRREAEKRENGSPLPRMQLTGDRLKIEQGFLTQWQMVFENPCERTLAMYAQPGLAVSYSPNINDNEVTLALSNTITIADDETDEIRMLKRIVKGMKDELRTFLSDGGTVARYFELIKERQKQELAIFQKCAAEMESEKKDKTDEMIYKLWMKKNTELRAKGIRTLPIPDELIAPANP